MYVTIDGENVLFQAIESVRCAEDEDRYWIIVRTMSGKEHWRKLEKATRDDAERDVQSLLNRIATANVVR